jgi:hypothetical protein
VTTPRKRNAAPRCRRCSAAVKWSHPHLLWLEERLEALATLEADEEPAGEVLDFPRQMELANRQAA